MKKNPKKTALPPDVLPADTKWPSYAASAKPWRVREHADLPLSLTFYQTAKGWFCCTLHISNASRRQAAGTAARTYAVGEDGKVYTLGRGPHVLTEVQVHLTSDNIARLGRWVALYRQGLADAGSIRDHISSRRAQGQLYRAAGRSSWTW